LAAFFALRAEASEPWRVVILAGADPTQPAALQQIRAARRALEAAAPAGAEFFTDSLDGLRFQNAELMPEFLALMRKKYQREHVDIVIALGDNALEFAARHHDEIWPGIPVLVSSVDKRSMERIGLPPGFSRVPFEVDIAGTLDIAATLQPNARRLVVVGGATEADRDLVARAVELAGQGMRHRWAIETWQGLPVRELLQRLAALDGGTAVVYTTMYRDGDGRAYFPYEVVRPMAQASPVPIYGWYPTYVEHGLTAGAMVGFEENGRITGELAANILEGRAPREGASVAALASRCTANVEQMERLGLRVALLPDGCMQTNVPPSIWREHRTAVSLVLAVFAAQAITIAALLWQRRRRQRAEDDATRRRTELAKAARLASVGELSASIAHEVGQPLGAILSNADAAELMLNAHADSAELREIHADIRRDALRASQVVQRLRALLNKQSIDFSPLDLDTALDDALVLVAPEARRRGVFVEVEFGADEGKILGDPVQLQQVLLNLAINAMDAMADAEPARRILSIATRAAREGFELSVADRGCGIDEAVLARIFDAFYTTKPHGMGLGLSIARSIVDSHCGRVTAAPRVGGGTVFTVWFPEMGAREHGVQGGASDPAIPPSLETPWTRPEASHS